MKPFGGESMRLWRLVSAGGDFGAALGAVLAGGVGAEVVGAGGAETSC